MLYDNLTVSQHKIIEDIISAAESGHYERKFQANFPKNNQGEIVILPVVDDKNPIIIPCEKLDFHALVNQKFILENQANRDGYNCVLNILSYDHAKYRWRGDPAHVAAQGAAGAGPPFERLQRTGGIASDGGLRWRGISQEALPSRRVDREAWGIPRRVKIVFERCQIFVCYHPGDHERLQKIP